MQELVHLDVLVEERLYGNSIALYIGRSRDGRYSHVLPAPLVVQHDDAPNLLVSVDPALELPRELVIALMTELWRKGLRPRGEHTDHGPQVEAMRVHLKDMRQLVLNQQAQLKAKDKTIEGLHRLLADALGHNTV